MCGRHRTCQRPSAHGPAACRSLRRRCIGQTKAGERCKFKTSATQPLKPETLPLSEGESFCTLHKHQSRTAKGWGDGLDNFRKKRELHGEGVSGWEKAIARDDLPKIYGKGNLVERKIHLGQVQRIHERTRSVLAHLDEAEKADNKAKDADPLFERDAFNNRCVDRQSGGRIVRPFVKQATVETGRLSAGFFHQIPNPDRCFLVLLVVLLVLLSDSSASCRRLS